MVAGGWSLDAVRTMRDFAAQLGAGMPRYLLAPEMSLLSYIDDLTARMYFDTFWNTGARLNEALALTPAGFMQEPSRRQPQAAVMLKTLVPEKVLQDLLGHRYARSTDVYTRVFSLDVLTGQGLSFSYDAQTARRRLAR